jgi:hypothetical protein
MADLITIRRWINSSTTQTTSYVTLKDEDFGEPNLIKKVYGVYFTYKTSTLIAKNSLLSYVLDGGTSFITTYVPTDNVSASSVWGKDSIIFTTPLSCQSIRLKFTRSGATFSLNDIGIEYRIIRKRVA